MTLPSSEQSQVPRGDVATDVKLGSRDPPQPQEEDHFLRSWKFGLVITSLYLGTLLVAIDTTIITVAVPKISTVFKSLDDIGWYGSGYLLTVTACQPSFGKVYKLFDVKSTYLASVAIFEGLNYPFHTICSGFDILKLSD